MRLALSVLAMTVVFSVQSCSKKVRSQSGGYVAPALSESADAHAISTLPTRPNGGDVVGKSASADLEAKEAQRNENLVAPLVFGQSVAGIKMTTTYSQARNILNYYASTNDGGEVYGEHIVIYWGAGTNPQPSLLYILEGYGTPLELPAPYGKISPGQSLGSFVSTLDDVKSFLLGVGTAIEKQPSSYNCETSLTCQLVETNDTWLFQYKRGALLVSKAAPYTLQAIIFTPVQTFYPRAKDAILYNLSVAGATFSTKRATFETRFGPSAGNNGVFDFYDLNSVAIEWGNNGTPLTMAANNTYQGTMNFGSTIGNRKINDPFADYVPAAGDPTAAELAKAIIRGVLNKPAAFDCTTATGAELCKVDTTSVQGLIIISIDRSSFIFTNDSLRQFLQYQVEAP